MFSPENMKFLSDNHMYVIYGLSAFFVVIYLVFSIRLIVTARRVGLNICATAMIPGVSLIHYIRKVIHKKKLSKPSIEDVGDDEIFSEDEEIQL